MKDFDKIIGRNAITMIYFFTSQCVPCEAMEPVLDQFERRMAGRVDIYRINTDADEVKVTKAALKKAVGRKLAARVLSTWVEDFVDEDRSEEHTSELQSR